MDVTQPMPQMELVKEPQSTKTTAKQQGLTTPAKEPTEKDDPAQSAGIVEPTEAVKTAKATELEHSTKCITPAKTSELLLPAKPAEILAPAATVEVIAQDMAVKLKAPAEPADITVELKAPAELLKLTASDSGTEEAAKSSGTEAKPKPAKSASQEKPERPVRRVNHGEQAQYNHLIKDESGNSESLHQYKSLQHHPLTGAETGVVEDQYQYDYIDLKPAIVYVEDAEVATMLPTKGTKQLRSIVTEPAKPHVSRPGETLTGLPVTSYRCIKASIVILYLLVIAAIVTFTLLYLTISSTTESNFAQEINRLRDEINAHKSEGHTVL